MLVLLGSLDTTWVMINADHIQTNVAKLFSCTSEETRKLLSEFEEKL